MKKIFLIIIVLFSLTGCFVDPYKNSKYGNQVVEAWYSYETETTNLGKIRREVESIGKFESSECKFIEKYKSNYIFNCTILYKELGETAIPFSKDKKLSVYAVFTPQKDKKFTYKVYNSSSEKGIWKVDEELK